MSSLGKANWVFETKLMIDIGIPWWSSFNFADNKYWNETLFVIHSNTVLHLFVHFTAELQEQFLTNIGSPIPYHLPRVHYTKCIDYSHPHCPLPATRVDQYLIPITYTEKQGKSSSSTTFLAPPSIFLVRDFSVSLKDNHDCIWMLFINLFMFIPGFIAASKTSFAKMNLKYCKNIQLRGDTTKRFQ